MKQNVQLIVFKDYKPADGKFFYMMLSRLIADCKYYNQHRYTKHLWAGDVDRHIQAMKEIFYLLLPIKPEWCTENQLQEYINMIK